MVIPFDGLHPFVVLCSKIESGIPYGKYVPNDTGVPEPLELPVILATQPQPIQPVYPPIKVGEYYFGVSNGTKIHIFAEKLEEETKVLQTVKTDENYETTVKIGVDTKGGITSFDAVTVDVNGKEFEYLDIEVWSPMGDSTGTLVKVHSDTLIREYNQDGSCLYRPSGVTTIPGYRHQLDPLVPDKLSLNKGENYYSNTWNDVIFTNGNPTYWTITFDIYYRYNGHRAYIPDWLYRGTIVYKNDTLPNPFDYKKAWVGTYSVANVYGNWNEEYDTDHYIYSQPWRHSGSELRVTGRGISNCP